MVTPPAKRRVLHSGDKGPDVKAYQRAVKKRLKQLGLASTNRQSGLYGAGTLGDTLRLQHRLKLKTDGKVGLLTWTAIDPCLDAYGKLLLTPKPKPVAPPGQRVAHEAIVLAAKAPRHYTQKRPYAKTLTAWVSGGGDCSGTAELAYLLAGADDPNGTKFNGTGYTGSQIARGVKVAEVKAQPGDLTFYGDRSAEHVVIEIGGGQVVSHGSEGGPRKLIRHYRGDYLSTHRYA